MLSGYLHNSFDSFYWLLGTQIRTPCEYYELIRYWLPAMFGFAWYHSTKRRLRNTRQSVHSSVRVRIGCDGPGYMNKGQYQCPALKGWKWDAIFTPRETGNLISKVRWTKETGEEEEPLLIMDEDELGDIEKILMKNWSPKIYDSLPTLTPDRLPDTNKKSLTLPKDNIRSISYAPDNGDIETVIPPNDLQRSFYT